MEIRTLQWDSDFFGLRIGRADILSSEDALFLAAQHEELKQQFELVKASKDREEAARRLSKWIFRAQQSGLPDFIKVSFTYQNWSKEILNSFEFPYTNGYIEGCNNRIKVLKRVSFGMPRFARFRRRIMHIMLN